MRGLISSVGPVHKWVVVGALTCCTDLTLNKGSKLCWHRRQEHFHVKLRSADGSTSQFANTKVLPLPATPRTILGFPSSLNLRKPLAQHSIPGVSVLNLATQRDPILDRIELDFRAQPLSGFLSIHFSHFLKTTLFR